MVEVSVIGITQDRYTGLPIIILGNEQERFAIPIWVGHWEAELLETELLGAVPPRPFPYDLLREVISAFGGEVERIVINDFDKGIYFAVIEVRRQDGEVLRIDSSDRLRMPQPGISIVWVPVPEGPAMGMQMISAARSGSSSTRTARAAAKAA